MRGLSSSVLSVAAMGLSSLTTYLTFFDASYTLTTANAEVSLQVQSGSSSSKGQRTAYLRVFVEPSLSLSNRGKLAVVVADASLHRSTSVDRCEIADGDKGKKTFTARGDTAEMPRVVEPETIKHLKLQFSLEPVDAKANPDGTFNVPSDQGLWCVKWTIFDPNGQRHEPVAPLIKIKRTFHMTEDRSYPQVKVEKDVPKEPFRLVARGLY